MLLFLLLTMSKFLCQFLLPMGKFVQRFVNILFCTTENNRFHLINPGLSKQNIMTWGLYCHYCYYVLVNYTSFRCTLNYVCLT